MANDFIALIAKEFFCRTIICFNQATFVNGYNAVYSVIKNGTNTGFSVEQFLFSLFSISYVTDNRNKVLTGIITC